MLIVPSCSRCDLCDRVLEDGENLAAVELEPDVGDAIDGHLLVCGPCVEASDEPTWKSALAKARRTP